MNGNTKETLLTVVKDYKFDKPNICKIKIIYLMKFLETVIVNIFIHFNLIVYRILKSQILLKIEIFNL